MKRAGSPFPASAKRPKLSNFDSSAFSLEGIAEQDAAEFLRDGIDEAKCIAGSIRSVRPFERKVEAVASIGPSERKHVLKLCFELPQKYLSLLDLAPLDQFRISLKGAAIQQVSSIPPSCTLPFFLVFSGGLHVMWTHKGPESKPSYLNTWTISGNNDVNIDSWYYTQEERSANSKIPSSVEAKEVTDKESHLKSARTSKRKQKVEAKRQKREALQQAESKTNMPTPPVSKGADNRQEENKPTGSLEPSKPPVQASETDLFKPGFRSGSELYIPIGEVQGRLKQYVHLTGVVTDISEVKMTRTQELSRHIQIVDPSIHGDYDAYGSLRGLKITCFTKYHKEWLPNPKPGDIILLRDVKITEFNGNVTGVGYQNKLRWAAYSPLRKAFHHGEYNKAPMAEGLGPGGTGVPFSPFLKPGSLESDYCARLFKWWQGVTGAVGNDTPALAQAGDRSCHSKQRQHLLISEAGPNVEPQGFFDCTIEILQVWVNPDSPFVNIYATDYTRQEGMMGNASHRLPASLSDYVLHFEMWEAAARIARDMKAGQYYHIVNARMRISPNGSLEAKVVQDKITLLQESDADRNSHLKGLLERKGIWAAKEAKLEEEIRFDTIQNAKAGKFFNCAVELLYASNDRNETPYIFVTDYTSHPSLPILHEPWAAGLERRVVKIALSDEQANIAASPTIGGFYAIRKLRLKHSPTDNLFRGYLGGHEKLVAGLNPRKTDNEHLNGLLRRKEQWTHERTQRVENEVAPSVPNSQRSGPFTRIKDIPLSNRDVARHEVVARVVDFFPLNLCDASQQRCRLCKTKIPDSQKACFKCADFEREHVQVVYQAFILIQDQDGEQIRVSINDKCPILAGLRRAHLRDDQAALSEFRKRISPLLNDQEAMHEEMESGKTVRYRTDGPLFCFDIETWVVIDTQATRAFSLLNYTRLD